MSTEQALDPAAGQWAERVKTKAALAAAAGAAAGTAQALLQQAPVVRYAVATSAGYALAFGCYGGLQEAVRRLTGGDTAVNSVVAGAGAGALFASLARGGRVAVPAALVCGGAAGAAHIALGWADVEGRARAALVALDLLDAPVPGPATSSAPAPAGAPQPDWRAHGLGDAAAPLPGGSAITALSPASGAAGREPEAAAGGGPQATRPGLGRWERWLPIRRLSDEEWEEHERRRKDIFRQRVEGTLEGGLPAMLEKHRQQAAEQQPD